MRHSIQTTATLIRQLNDYTGRGISWLTALMAITVLLIILFRSAFNLGSIALQESISYMHAMVFMLCLAYTAGSDGHVRVDILYRRLSVRGKAWVNAVGGIVFLLPYTIFLFAISWHFVVESWAIGEASINPGGIPAVFLLKTLIPTAALMLALHGLSDVLTQLISITYTSEDDA